MASLKNSRARARRGELRNAIALAAAAAELCSACGARSGLRDAFAFGGASGGSDSSEAGSGVANASAGSGATARACGFLIDDMEDGTGRICSDEGRVGAWYEYNDGFGVQLPPQAQGTPLLPLELPQGFGRSGRAMYSSYHYPNPSAPHAPQPWGAGIGVDLAFDGSTYRTYDARFASGISFWVRSNIITGYEVRINTTDTTPIEHGGTCAREYCGAFAQAFSFQSKWTNERVRFSKLTAFDDTGSFIEFHPERLTSIQFFFIRYPTDSYEGEIWVDDLWFMPHPPPPQ